MNLKATTRASAIKASKRKLAGLVSALALVWGISSSANATIDNTVTVTGFVNGVPIVATATENVDVVNQIATMSVVKTGTLNDGGDGSADVGDTISYTFDVKNTGNVTLINVTIADALATPGSEILFADDQLPTTSQDAGVNGSWDELQPGETLRMSATYTLTAGDISNAFVTNTATASATTVPGMPVSQGDTNIVPLNVNSAIDLQKVATLDDGGDGIANAGDTIAYQFTVTNTGNVTLTDVSVSDPLVNMASLSDPVTVVALLEGALNGTDDIATASFDAKAAFEGPVRSFGTSATQHIARMFPGRDTPQLPVALHVTRKAVALSGDAAALQAGDRIGVYFDLINSGDGVLTGIAVDQPGMEAFGGHLDLLAPNTRDNASIIFTRTLSLDDIANGMIDAPATVSFKTRGKSHDVALVDVIPLGDMRALDEIATASITPSTVASLAPGAATVFNATYILTQADIDAGVVNNTAEASGTDVLGNSITMQDSATTPLAPAPAIAAIKEGLLDLGVDGEVTAGDTINFTFTVTNTGNVTLSNITLADPLPGIVLAGGPIASLAPGASDSTTLTATYAITQADVDAGEVQNQAQVTGTAPDGTTNVSDLTDDADETQDDPTIVPVAKTPKISLIKTPASPAFADANGNNLPDAGEIASFNLEVRNTGNVTVNDVSVQDRNPLVTVTPAPPTGLSLAPNATPLVFTGAYAITQADIDAGKIENIADANAVLPDSTPITDGSHPTDEDGEGVTELPLTQAPGIALLKKVASITDSNGNSVTDEGDVINYAFDIYNTGNVTLANVTITDPLADSGSISAPLVTLAPGAIAVAAITATHTVTAQDRTIGEVVNTATATAALPLGGTITDVSDPTDITENDPTVTPVEPRAEVALLKIATGIADTNGNSVPDAGDTVSYRFEVRNTGNVTVSNVMVSDLVGGVTMVGGPIATLDAAETDTTTFTATYVLTAADITAGQFANSAQVSATGPDTAVVTDTSDESDFAGSDPTIVTISNAPVIALVKTVARIEDANTNAQLDAGDRIHYAFAVSNLGNTLLTNVTVTDDNATVSGGPLASLAIGATDTTTFTAVHIVTQADINLGRVENQATAHGRGPVGPIGAPIEVEDLSDESDETGNDPTFTSLSQAPDIAVVKTVSSVTDRNGNGLTDIGDVVNYAFAVHNTGNVTLTDVTLTDGNAVVRGGPIASLDPNRVDSRTFTATHVITLADAEAEQVVNQATVQGMSPAGGAVSDASDGVSPNGNAPTIIRVAAPAPVLTKVAQKSTVRRGERVAYTITGSNLRTGPYDVADIMPPGFTYVPGTATLNGATQAPVIAGNVLTFANITPAADGKVTIKLQLLASTTQAVGKFVNRARLIFTANGNVLAEARATVQIKEEHVFDCGEIIGRVFDDLNGNGYMDEGERGIPGVRLATVKGVLITTDKNGLYHISCADIPNAAIGSNFLLKLDTRTLPAGYRVTTENPRDVRLTPGKIVKLNFGASRNQDIVLDLRKDAFTTGIDLRATWLSGIDRLVDLLEQGRGNLQIVYRCGQYAPIADERLDAVADLVQRSWAAAGNNKRLKISTRVECGK